MPEVILKFNLPEEEGEFRAAVDGQKWKSLVHHLMEDLRAVRKHSENNERSEFANELLTELFDNMTNDGLIIYE